MEVTPLPGPQVANVRVELVPRREAVVAAAKGPQRVAVVAEALATRRPQPGAGALAARRTQPQAANGVVALASTRQQESTVLVTTRTEVAAIAAAIEEVEPEVTIAAPCSLSRVIVEDLQ
jgi:hypothetical protein